MSEISDFDKQAAVFNERRFDNNLLKFQGTRYDLGLILEEVNPTPTFDESFPAEAYPDINEEVLSRLSTVAKGILNIGEVIGEISADMEMKNKIGKAIADILISVFEMGMALSNQPQTQQEVEKLLDANVAGTIESYEEAKTKIKKMF